jgi:hypothetical protein
MAQEEIYGTRDRTYSAWHRRNSLRRFVGIECAQTASMIDLDAALYLNYDNKTKEPTNLIETAIDVGQSYKTATVTRNLARRVVPLSPAYTLLYTKSKSPNPADPTQQDIDRFRYRRIWPEPATGWIICSPHDWAHILMSIRKDAARAIDDAHDFPSLLLGGWDLASNAARAQFMKKAGLIYDPTRKNGETAHVTHHFGAGGVVWEGVADISS